MIAMPHLRYLIGLLLALVSLATAAQPRAWLDRDRIGQGETVTLNIETTQAAAPNYAPLRREFAISGSTSRRQFELVNGRSSTRTLYAVALQPRRDGLLTIPALAVGNERTAPLTLLVAPGRSATPTRAGDDVFIESEADDQDPYVQQAVGWVVRLYSAVPLVSGQLDQASPDGASLQRVGDDAQYTRQLGNRQYTVVERRYLLVPERSGALTIPGASFEGRGAGGFFDDLFGDRGGALQARAAPRIVQVRAVPANAPQPWLPLHDLQLRYQSTPQDLRTGSAATLTIEATADGASAAQMPDLQLPAIDGVQVFAEPAKADETFSNGRPRVKVSRTFSLVPARAGAVKMPGVRLGWWDVRAGQARTATLPALSWQVLAADGAAVAAVPAATTADAARAHAPFASTTAGASRMWVLATALFAALWLFTLVWGLQHRAQPAALGPASSIPGASTPLPRASGEIRAALKRALATGDFAEVEQALCASATPPARDLDTVVARLDDERQREALVTMQRARWGGGDGVAARSALRDAFAKGPRWRVVEGPTPTPLPPLYPPAR
ncbi:BatD family protein [Lysobacter koreensis]|uniref:BatD family protein n=1 Tax=Lysobacter koreensis TaxID=266122 RepID=A0ABW2YLD8_9GAMM